MISNLADRLKGLLTASQTSPALGEFVQGINLGGHAVSIEGHLWNSYEAAIANGLSIPGASALTTQIKPKPGVSRDLRQMLNTVVYRKQTLEIQQALHNGSYFLYLWVMENYASDWHSLEVRACGETIATQVGKLGLGSWARYGAYAVTVSNGELALTIDTGNPAIDAHLMGISLYR